MFNTNLAKLLGAYFLENRRSLNITQKTLKERLGFSAQFLGHIEKGKAMIPDQAFPKMISALNLNKDELRKIFYRSVDLYLDTLFENHGGASKNSTTNTYTAPTEKRQVS